MDEIELTQMFMEYAKTKKALEALEAQIKAAVLEIGESRKIAGVTATYYKASNETPDYESAARAAMPEGYNLEPFSTTTVSIRWRDVCLDLFVIPNPGAEKPARVTIK